MIAEFSKIPRGVVADFDLLLRLATITHACKEGLTQDLIGEIRLSTLSSALLVVSEERAKGGMWRRKRGHWLPNVTITLQLIFIKIYTSS